LNVIIKFQSNMLISTRYNRHSYDLISEQIGDVTVGIGSKLRDCGFKECHFMKTEG
jgi:hypothetical protein